MTKSCGQNVSKGEILRCWLDLSANFQNESNQSVIELQTLLTNSLHRNLTKINRTIVNLIQIHVHPRDCVDPGACCLFKQEPRAPKPSLLSHALGTPQGPAP